MMGVRVLSGIRGLRGLIGRVSPALVSHDFWDPYPYERLGHTLDIGSRRTDVGMTNMTDFRST